MASWDTIYKQYQQGGEAWATLSEGIDKRFISLLKKESFPKKHALDIGCGTGKYLAYLEEQGFVVDAIDSSPTAIEITTSHSSKHGTILVADMYNYEYPRQRYDLVLSISTIHHGKKLQVKQTLERLYASLLPKGWTFITLPNFDSAARERVASKHTQLEPGTYAPQDGPEEGIPHSFYTMGEVQELFSMYQQLSIELDEIGRWFVIGKK